MIYSANDPHMHILFRIISEKKSYNGFKTFQNNIRINTRLTGPYMYTKYYDILLYNTIIKRYVTKKI